MDIVKKNILSIICGVVALVALTALAWPVGGMYDYTQGELNKRQKVDKDIGGLMTRKRSWPVIPDIGSGAQAPLTQFPNEERIKKGLEIKDKVSAQAARMKETTASNNKHELLVDNVLPTPRDLRFKFQQMYMETVQKTLKSKMQGTTPPTDQDVIEAGKKLYTTDYKPRLIHVLGKDVNKDQIEAEWYKACLTLQSKLRVETAQSAKVYIEPDWLTIHSQMLPTNTAGPKETDIWFAQNMLWVQGDIIDALNRLNATAHNVTDAPIKHIFHISVPEDASQYVMNAQTGGAPAGDAATPLGKAFGVSPTGRVCNPIYDVVRFTLVMNVDKNAIPAILVELQRGKLITVEQMDLSSVDGITAAEDGYVYGDVPVVKLTITGEELFLRDWTVPLMPDPIKALLQVPAQAPGNGAPPPAR